MDKVNLCGYYLFCFQVVFQVLCEETFQTFTEKQFVPDVRAAIMKLFLSGERVPPD